MGEKRPDEVHEAIAREIEENERDDFFKWLAQNEPDFDGPTPEKETKSKRADREHSWSKRKDNRWPIESDDTIPMSGESFRHRGSTMEDWGEPEPLY